MVSIIRALAGEPGIRVVLDAEMAIIELAFVWFMEHAELSGRSQASETVRTYSEHLHDWFDALEQSGFGWRETDERVIAARQPPRIWRWPNALRWQTGSPRSFRDADQGKTPAPGSIVAARHG